MKIIWTNHLWTKEQIEKEIKDFNPDIIGVEFDEIRLNAMVINPIQQEVVDDSLIGKISKAIKKKAEEENLTYGSDMMSASRYALDNKIPLLLCDRNILDIKNLMNKIPQDELANFVTELNLFEAKTLKEQVANLDADKVLNELRTKYPVSFEFLITSREVYISYKILKCLKENPDKKLIVFLGEGHKQGVSKLL